MKVVRLGWRVSDSWVALDQVRADWREAVGKVVEVVVIVVPAGESLGVVEQIAQDFEIQAAAPGLINFLVEHQVHRVYRPRCAEPY